MGTQVATTGSCFIRPDEDPIRWNAYVHSHPKGSVFQLAEMLAAFGATPKHTVWARAYVDEDGRILALLAAVEVATIDGIVSRVASRSIYYAEPLCEATAEGRQALERLLIAHDSHASQRTLFAEVRNLAAPSDERTALEACGYEYLDYLNYEIDVTADTETLWRRLSKSARNKITRSQRRGVRVVTDTSHEGIERMYVLVRESYERSAVPLVDIGLFQEALARLPSSTVQIRIATFQHQDVAAGISLVHGGRFFAWYGGSKRLKGIAPFDCLTWDEVRWCAENEMALYDFGGAGWPDQAYGPRDFKAKFGGQLVRYGRYRRVYAKLAMKVATASYKLLRRIRPR